jgi:hypothetical protein
VFQPPRNDYQETFRLGERNSTERKQYDTGGLGGRQNRIKATDL